MVLDKITHLNEILSRYIILRHHLQQAHWHAEGVFFFSWHQMFEQHYEALNEIIDSYAEVLKTHGVLHAKKMGLMSLEGQEPDVSDNMKEGLLKNLLHILKPLKKMMHDTTTDSKMADFVVIVDNLTQSLSTIDKMIWFYEASLA